MEARICGRFAHGHILFLSLYLAVVGAGVSHAQFRPIREHVAQSENFIVFASSPEWAKQVGQVAEQHRRNLAIYWLGSELPTWSERCPIHVQAGPNLDAGGETRYTLMGGSAGAWMMTVTGTPERVLDSVLPHEITHTIFACHFAKLHKYMPRWADEGACTTVEHVSEKRKHEDFLQKFLRTGRGLAFNEMFRLKEYPQDILPLYAQGHSAVQFLLDQGGSRKFIAFVEMGMRTENWPAAINEHYAYESIGDFQTQWNHWLADGSPENLLAYAPVLRTSQPNVSLASTETSLLPGGGQLSDKTRFAIHNAQPAPVSLAQHASEEPVVSQSTREIVADPQSLAMDRPTARVPSVASTTARSAGTPELENVSWYERQFREVTGEEPPPYNGRPGNARPIGSTTVAANAAGAVSPSNPQAFQAAIGPSPLPRQSSARPMPAHSPGIQVLDWGNSAPVPGVQRAPMGQTTSPTRNAPLYR
ncbi:hypothetical protein [Aureliella helgolandensis]|uniref:Peptidase MA-like domain-containing protein n=1 Tax=Aureliella helgolandensis TaxID=2527968 RepID=A0A518G425_9BACT|nr:hypothetical protein [Aureliella helgolandensis]QDV23325.1 hypothetical protein Q31a_16230 [Aureliella helgolandensis]